jgi:hypothetical protein
VKGIFRPPARIDPTAARTVSCFHQFYRYSAAFVYAETARRALRPAESRSGFWVVGVYSPGPQTHVTWPMPENHAKALQTIRAVKVLTIDPACGADGPLVRLWKPQDETGRASPDPIESAIPRDLW